MKDHISRHKQSLIALILITFLLMPVCGLGAAIFFGMINTNEVMQVMQLGLMPAFLAIMLTFVVIYFRHFLDPLSDKLQIHADTRHLAALLHRRIQRFSLVYWGLFIFYSAALPLLYIFSLNNLGQTTTTAFTWTLISLQLTISILVGMPAFLLMQDKLGSLASFTGLLKSQNSMYARFLMLAGLLPILSYTLLLEYHWYSNGSLNNHDIVIWTALTILTALITHLTARSLKQSMLPVTQALSTSGAIKHESLSQLKAQSADEIGFMTQALGRVFQRLSDQETRIHAIIDNAAEGVIVTNDTGMIDTFNLAAQKLFNYNSQEVRGKPLSWIINDVINSDGSPIHIKGRHQVKGIRRDSSQFSVSVSVSGVILSGQPVFIYLVDDISATEAAKNKRRKAEALYRDLVETAHDLVWSIDTEGNWLYLNSACINLYGYSADEMIGKPVSEFQSPDYAEQDDKTFARIKEGQDLYQYETVHINREGRDIHLSFNARALFDDNGNLLRITGTARDITETREYQRQLSYQAEHDALTGLYNRRFFQAEMDRVIARIARSAETAGLLYVDLDQFKYINDTLGHAAGDRLLIEISQLLSSNARDGDLLARFGGDEFTLLLYDIEAINLEQVAENFRSLFDDFIFYNQGNGFSISCSIGAALIDDETETSEMAMSHADLACNVAKTRGRNCVNIYRPQDRDEQGMADDMGWAARVRDMIDNDKFILAYQPIISTDRLHTRGYELLLRMPTNDGQIILPGGFMPAAERFGLIHSLDRWMVKKTIRTLASMHESGNYTNFCINLSDRCHEDEELLTLIENEINAHSIDAKYISFEISETAIITNLNQATAFIRQLRTLGCGCTLDDFGSGFCSFGYLKDLPIDTLKIDGAVISEIASNPVDRALVESMNNIAHVMGMVTVAECVEDEQTMSILTEIGIDFVQGHFIARPASDIEQIRASGHAQQILPAS